MEKEVEFYNKEFPKTFNDLVHIGRDITKGEISHADKDGLIELVIALKRKEINYDIERQELKNILEKALDFIDTGACMFTNKQRVELVDEIKEHFK